MEKDFIAPDKFMLTIQMGMDGRQRQLSIPKWTLGVFVLVQIILLICTLVMIFSWSGISARERKIASLLTENSTLRNKMETSLGMVGARLDSLNNKINSTANDSLKQSSTNYPYYSGKTSTGDSQYLAGVVKRLELINDRISEIDGQLGGVAISSDTEPTKKVPVVRACAPSIYPAFGNIFSCFEFLVSPITNEIEFHTGIDLANEAGTPIYATASGVIVKAKYESGYGKFIRIDHQNGYETLYGHMSSFKVREGDVVKKGQIIGFMGSTGQSTGPHVHYEVWAGGVKADPMNYLNLVENYASTE